MVDVPFYLENERKTATFWNNEENIRGFLDKIAREYHVEHVTQWKRITASLIKSKGGNVITIF